MNKITCSLCGMHFSEHDPHIIIRKMNHEIWHMDCKKQKRNTTEGKVVWQ